MVLSLALVAVATAGTLDVVGACGGPVEIRSAGLTPGGTYAVLSANGPGAAVVPGGPCQGVQLGLDGSFKLRRTATADGSGDGLLTVNLPAATCGAHLQVVDAATCAPTNVARVPYPDADGDGYPADEDCDDADAFTYPGALELCDGVQNDCTDGSWTSDDGLATWFGADGTAADRTTSIQGSLGAPRITTFAASGTYRLCGGTWYAAFRTDTAAPYDVAVEGQTSGSAVTLDNTGTNYTTLSFHNAGTIRVSGLGIVHDGLNGGFFASPRGDMNVEIQGLNIQGGRLDMFDSSATGPGSVSIHDTVVMGDGVSVYVQQHPTDVFIGNLLADADMGFFGVSPAESRIEGYGLYHQTSGDVHFFDATVVLDDVQVNGGDGVKITGADVTFSDFEIQNTDAWGILVGANTRGGTFQGLNGSIQNTRFAGVDARLGSSVFLWESGISACGAVAGSGVSVSDSDAVLENTIVTGNVVSGRGGGAAVANGTLTCTADVGNIGGFTANTAGLGGGGVWVDAGGTLISNDCTFGEGALDNTPDDVNLDGAQTYTYGDSASFTCTVDAYGAGSCT